MRTSSTISKHIYRNGGGMWQLAGKQILTATAKICIYNVPTLFLISTKEVLNVQGSWQSPNTSETMVHKQAFCITWQHPSKVHPLSPTWDSSVGWALYMWFFTSTQSYIKVILTFCISPYDWSFTYKVYTCTWRI